MGKNWHLAILLILFFSSLQAISNSLNNGLIASWDNPSHLVKAGFMEKSIDFENAGLWGWFNKWYAGAAPFIFYAPGFSLLVVFSRMATLNFLALNDAIKIVLALSYSAFPLAIYWLCRRIDFSKRDAVLAAVFSLTSSSYAGIGIEGIYDIGLYTHFIGIILFMIYLGLFHESLEKENKKTHLLAGLVLGFIILTHTITTAYAFISSAVYLLLRLVYWKKTGLRRLLLIPSIGLLISLFWLFPLLSSFELFGPDAGFYPFSINELFDKIVSNRMVVNELTIYFLPFALAAAFIRLVKRNNSMIPVYLIIMVVLTTLIGSNYVVKFLEGQKIDAPLYPTVVRIFTTMFQTRAIAYLGVLLPILAGLGAGGLLDAASFFFAGILRLAKIRNWGRIAIVFSALFFILLASALIFQYSQEQQNIGKRFVKIIEVNHAGPYAEWKEAFLFLKENTKPDSLVKADINFQAIPYPGFLGAGSMIVLETGLRTVDGNQIEMCNVDLCNYMNGLNYLNEIGENEAKELFHRSDVDYLLVAGKDAPQFGFLTKIFDRGGNIKIYLVEEIGGRDYYIKDKVLGENKYEFTIQLNRNEKTNISLPVQYNDHWVAELNGGPAPVGRKDGFVAFELQPGMNKVGIRFQRKPLETFFLIISALTLLTVLYFLVKDSAKQRA
jgi:hypothetical protein